MVKDSFAEWLVSAVGVLLAIGVVLPKPFRDGKAKLAKKVPHPTEVNDWLGKHGL